MFFWLEYWFFSLLQLKSKNENGNVTAAGFVAFLVGANESAVIALFGARMGESTGGSG